MPLRVLVIVLVAVTCRSAFGQECGTIKQTGNEMTITIDSIRPMWSLANTLSDKFGVLVSAEEPSSISLADAETKDSEVVFFLPKSKKYPVPKRRLLEIHAQASNDGKPASLQMLLEDAVREMNEHAPYGYRLDHDKEFFVLVPTTSRDANGKIVDSIAVLDRKVTIPPGTRPISESAQMMADQLSAQTGLKVSCCQGLVSRISWGGEPPVRFEANNEPARRVLERLIRLEQENDPSAKRMYWSVACDGGYCFINVHPAFGQICRQYGHVASD